MARHRWHARSPHPWLLRRRLRPRLGRDSDKDPRSAAETSRPVVHRLTRALLLRGATPCAVSSAALSERGAAPAILLHDPWPQARQAGVIPWHDYPAASGSTSADPAAISRDCFAACGGSQ